MHAFFTRTTEKIRVSSLRHAQSPRAPWYLFVLGVSEALFFPLPVETLLIPLVLTRVRTWWFYAIVGTVGTTLGGILGYGIGWLFFETLGASLVAWYGASADVAYIKELLTVHVAWTTFVAAFTLLPDKVIMPIAGLLQAPFLVFVVSLTAGRFLRTFMVAYIVDRWGASAARLALRYSSEIIIVIVVAIGIFFAGHFFVGM